MEQSISILIIIEDKTLLLYLKTFIAKNYPECIIFTSEEGWDAWDKIINNKPSIVIADINVTGLNGIQICKKLKEVRELRNTYFVILTSIIEKSQRNLALQEGADDFIIKPFVEEELKTKLNSGFRICNLQHRLKDESSLLTDLAEQLLLDINDMVTISMKFCQSRIPSSVDMLRNVADASKWIAANFGDLEEDEIHDIEIAALLSYTGKMFLPDNLLKTQVLIDGIPSNNLMYQVPVFAHEILSGARILNQVAKILYHVYENFDGTGIPEHIKSWQIPLGSRIIRVAVDYEELRTFKKLPPRTIIEKFQLESKKLYDHRAVILMEQFLASRGSMDSSIKERSITLDEMLSGMLLSRDLYTNSGVKIVSSGMVLNQSMIDKIIAHNTSDPILGVIFIQE